MASRSTAPLCAVRGSNLWLWAHSRDRCATTASRVSVAEPMEAPLRASAKWREWRGTLWACGLLCNGVAQVSAGNAVCFFQRAWRSRFLRAPDGVRGERRIFLATHSRRPRTDMLRHRIRPVLAAPFVEVLAPDPAISFPPALPARVLPSPTARVAFAAGDAGQQAPLSSRHGPLLQTTLPSGGLVQHRLQRVAHRAGAGARTRPAPRPRSQARTYGIGRRTPGRGCPQCSEKTTRALRLT